jgi:hypothetical protein
MRNISFILALGACSILLLSACARDCREDVRLGDFEFSQGNYERAEKLFRQALETDSVACADVRERLQNPRRFPAR